MHFQHDCTPECCKYLGSLPGVDFYLATRHGGCEPELIRRRSDEPSDYGCMPLGMVRRGPEMTLYATPFLLAQAAGLL